jgi:hypothetical protein
MSFGLEARSGGNPVYGFLQAANIELLGFPAIGADQMTMLTFIDCSLEASPAVAKIDLSGNSAFGKESQCPIYGGKPYPRILLSNHAVQIVGRDMFGGGEKSIQNCSPLGCLLQSFLPEIIGQDLPFLLHDFPSPLDSLNYFPFNISAIENGFSPHPRLSFAESDPALKNSAVLSPSQPNQTDSETHNQC